MTPFEAWCRAVEARHEPEKHTGEIALSNLRYDAANDRVLREKRAAFRKRLEELHAANPGIPPDLLIQTVARENPDEYSCQGPPIQFEGCSRIVPAKDFVEENIDLEAAGGWQIDDFVPPDYLEILEESLEGLAINTMPKERSFAWVTRTSEVRQLRDTMSEDELALSVRNRCGLLHHCGPVPMQYVEVQYPEKDLEIELHAPTFLEGAPYHVYVSKAQSGHWGTALDLQEIRDGLPEAVHRRVPFDGRFRMKRVGFVSGDMDVDTAKVLVHMPKGWTGDHRELEDLFT